MEPRRGGNRRNAAHAVGRHAAGPVNVGRYPESGDRQLRSARQQRRRRDHTIDDAAAEYRTLLQLEPLDHALRLKLAELLCGNQRLQAGLAEFAKAQALAPDDPEVYEREGRALLLAGRRRDALKSFTLALELRPQNPGLREVVRSLRGEDIGSGAEYALDVKPLSHEADSFPGEDAITLVDVMMKKEPFRPALSGGVAPERLALRRNRRP